MDDQKRTDEFIKRIRTYSIEELRESLSGLDEDKYPDRKRILIDAIQNYTPRDSDLDQQASRCFINKKLFAKSNASIIILSISTLFLYQFIWFYKSWRRVKEIENSRISPLLRSFFYAFTSLLFFKRMQRSAEANGSSISIEPTGLAALTMASRLTFNGTGIVMEIFSWLTIACAAYISFRANQLALAINVNTNSDEANFEPITFFEQVCVLFGLVLWAFIIIIFNEN